MKKSIYEIDSNEKDKKYYQMNLKTLKVKSITAKQYQQSKKA
ncbi:hypothetical protein [Solibacillus sp.]